MVPRTLRRYISIIALLFVCGGCADRSVFIVWLARPFDTLATPAQLADIQVQRPETVILPVDLRFNAAFKLPRAIQVQPEIICFGSSRAGGFRAGMFAPRRFYNMSYTGWTTDQVLDIFDRTTRETHPRVVILELDYFLFANHWQQWFATQRNDDLRPAVSLRHGESRKLSARGYEEPSAVRRLSRRAVAFCRSREHPQRGGIPERRIVREFESTHRLRAGTLPQHRALRRHRPTRRWDVAAACRPRSSGLPSLRASAASSSSACNCRCSAPASTFWTTNNPTVPVPAPGVSSRARRPAPGLRAWVSRCSISRVRLLMTIRPISSTPSISPIRAWRKRWPSCRPIRHSVPPSIPTRPARSRALACVNRLPRSRR